VQQPAIFQVSRAALLLDVTRTRREQAEPCF
jgi:hypothetical protein